MSRDFWAPPADSADLECYSPAALHRSPLPSGGGPVPARTGFSPAARDLTLTDGDIVVLDDNSYGRLTDAAPLPRRPLARPAPCRCRATSF